MTKIDEKKKNVGQFKSRMVKNDIEYLASDFLIWPTKKNNAQKTSLTFLSLWHQKRRTETEKMSIFVGQISFVKSGNFS